MKITELIRYIEDTAAYDSPLVFYSSAYPDLSTEGWEYISGHIGDYRAPFIGYITLSFDGSNDGVSLYREDLLEWLYHVKQDYGNQKIRIFLYRGGTHGAKEFLEDSTWGRVETNDGVYYAVTSPPNGPGFGDSMRAAWANNSGAPCT